ncbi:uncharacterized protein LOC115389257 isoform X3 [Salarias fasciatus]|uniref:uncharacterized protein LOC115389257 isoform X3 n=1 Tax=Salarias fasciatus TaxID=181472 RepID=UPI0011768074|nr:uncharacterized protein LOC115389257 isoform X3 [Salarias fasciatus]
MISADKMNKMRTFHLLLVCLTAGCRAKSKGKDCSAGEVKYTCNKKKCTMTGVIQQSGVPLWKVIIKYPEEEKQRKNSNKLQFEVDDACVTAFPHVAKKTKTTTIACNLAHIINSSSTDKFFCKVNRSDCSPRRGVSITPTSRGFNITISQVTLRNQGEYWCGLKENTKYSGENKNYSAALKKIQLLVEDIKYFRKSRTTGHNVSYHCNYADSPAVVDSFICKGDDPRVCQTTVNSSTPENGRFSMKDEKDQRNITVTMRELTVKDSGSYWCGAETSEREGGKIFFNRLSLTVGPAQSSSSASPLILTTEPSVGSHSGSQAHISVVICVVLVLLLLLLVPVSTLIYKRCSASKTSAAPNRNSTKEMSGQPIILHTDLIKYTIHTNSVPSKFQTTSFLL